MARDKYLLVGPALLLVIWFLATTSGIISPLFLPQPGHTATKLLALFSTGVIWIDIGMTLFRILWGFALAALLGIPAGLLLGASDRLQSSFEVVIDFFRSLPSTALFPLFLLIFGIGETAKIAIAAFVCFWIILVSTINGVAHSSQTRKKIAKIFGANPRQTLLAVTLPEALPQIATGLRVALSISFIVVVVAEMFIGTNLGLGHRIYDAYLTYRVAELYATLVITGLLGYLLNKIFVLEERHFIHWTGK